MVTRAREQELPALAAFLAVPTGTRGRSRLRGQTRSRAGVSATSRSSNGDNGHRPPRRAGWVVVNPPYGVRVAERVPYETCTPRSGNVLRARFAGWRVGMLSAGEQLDRQTVIAVSRAVCDGEWRYSRPAGNRRSAPLTAWPRRPHRNAISCNNLPVPGRTWSARELQLTSAFRLRRSARQFT